MCSPDLTVENKTEVKSISSELLVRFEANPVILSRIVTSDEIWAHRFEPETKGKSLEWHRLQSPGKKIHSSSANEVMISVVRDREGVILMAAIQRGETDYLRRLYQDAD